MEFWEGMAGMVMSSPPPWATRRVNCARTSALRSSAPAKKRSSSTQDSWSMRRRASASSRACSARSARFSHSTIVLRAASESWGLEDAPWDEPGGEPFVGDWTVDWKDTRRRSALSARRFMESSCCLRDSVSSRAFARSVASWAGDEACAGGEPFVWGAGSSRVETVAGGGGCGDADMGRSRGAGWAGRPKEGEGDEEDESEGVEGGECDVGA